MLSTVYIGQACPWRTEFLTSIMFSVIQHITIRLSCSMVLIWSFSQECPQQGDPLGPLLFCNTIHPLLQSLEENLSLGFLGDLSLGGPESVVADDVSKIIWVGEDQSLMLNTSKCELITHRGFNV